jgi:hypothetical protein
MKLLALIVSAAVLLAAGAAHAQSSQTAPRASPEQRAAAREKWQNATPEQREAWKAEHPEATRRAQERRQSRQQPRPSTSP